MMQDTVLNLCKDSVAEFVKFMLAYIPEKTEIFSTAEVKNIYNREILQEDEESENLMPRENDLPGTV